MKELPAIEATYDKLADILDDELQKAEQRPDYHAANRIKEKQQVNDSAYFLLVWGQLEARVNEIAEKAIRKRRADARWEYRRAWDGLNPDDMRRIRFEDRLAIVLDRQAGKGSSFNQAIRLYGERNRVAHGTSLAQGIDVPTIIAQVYQFESEMSD